MDTSSYSHAYHHSSKSNSSNANSNSNEVSASSSPQRISKKASSGKIQQQKSQIISSSYQSKELSGNEQGSDFYSEFTAAPAPAAIPIIRKPNYTNNYSSHSQPYFTGGGTPGAGGGLSSSSSNQQQQVFFKKESLDSNLLMAAAASSVTSSASSSHAFGNANALLSSYSYNGSDPQQQQQQQQPFNQGSQPQPNSAGVGERKQSISAIQDSFNNFNLDLTAGASLSSAASSFTHSLPININGGGSILQNNSPHQNHTHHRNSSSHSQSNSNYSAAAVGGKLASIGRRGSVPGTSSYPYPPPHSLPRSNNPSKSPPSDDVGLETGYLHPSPSLGVISTSPNNSIASSSYTMKSPNQNPFSSSLTSNPGNVPHTYPKGTKFICDECGKTYKHPNCLAKHKWEHTEAWKDVTSKMGVSKHQQVQLLEAAAVLVGLGGVNVVGEGGGMSVSSPQMMSIDGNSGDGEGGEMGANEDDTSSQVDVFGNDWKIV